MSTTTTDHLDALESLAPRVSRLIPEIGHGIVPLVALLRSVYRLDLKGDRRLLGLDTNNLVQGITETLALREACLDTPDLQEAACNLARLAADMHVRANALLANRIQTVVIHSAVAAHRATDGPIDVTKQVRTLIAAPTPPFSDAPGKVVATQPYLGDVDHDSFGRVGGAFLYTTIPTGNVTAAHDAVILPAGSVATFSTGDVFVLYTEGTTFGNSFAIPDHDPTTHLVVVQAGSEGNTLYGPAVFSCPPNCAGLLSEAHAALRTVDPIAQTLKAWPFTHEGNPMTKESQGFLFGFLTPIMLLLSFILPSELADVFTWMPSYWPTFGAFVALWTIPLVSFYPIKLRKAKQKVRTGLDAIPTSLRSFHVRERMHALLQRHKRPTPLQSFDLEKVRQHMDVNALPRLPEGFGGIFSEPQGLNMIPATKIEARNGHDVRVMQPLLALPAPSPVDDVVVPMRAAFSKT